MWGSLCAFCGYLCGIEAREALEGPVELTKYQVDKAHIAYAIVGVFASIFSLISLFVKEKLYIGEATVAAIVGLIVGPHCLNWFAPTTWGNSDYITLEISRIVLCLQIFAVAVELPKKYMLKHWVSVAMLLVPVMTIGWLVVGLFTWALIPGFNFADGLLISACITATDPVLAAAVVGKGKFARRVPGHLRNILSAESGCNDGMAFPFIYLSLNIILHGSNIGEIFKDWICVTILYECILGCFIGVVIGYCGRHLIKYCEKHQLIDRESFLSFYIVLAFTCAGFGSMLGVDDLLVSFAAGAAFAWDGWFARKTEESHVSTVIDLLLNLAYFIYFGAIIPWPQYNNHETGTDVWRLIVLAIVVIFLRRIPAVLVCKPLIPDIKTWREAFFCAYFGPIGVGAIFAAILARGELEGASTHSATPLAVLPPKDAKYYHLIVTIWPIVTFLVITSIIVHGSSVAVITLGRHLKTMAISMSFTGTSGNQNSASWMNRLPDLKTSGRSFSLHRIDTMATSNTSNNDEKMLQSSDTIETSGVPVRPAGGMVKKRKKKSSKSEKFKLNLRKMYSHHTVDNESENKKNHIEKIQREKEAKAATATFALGGAPVKFDEEKNAYTKTGGITPSATFNEPQVPFPQTPDEQQLHFESQSSDESVSPVESEVEDVNVEKVDDIEKQLQVNKKVAKISKDLKARHDERRPTRAYTEGRTVIVEDQHGEIIETASLSSKPKDSTSVKSDTKSDTNANANIDGEPLEAVQSRSSILSKTLKNGGSLLERIASNASSKEHSKYTAYRVNDELIIENDEGEVIRRYRINHHESRASPITETFDPNAIPKRSSRSSTVVGGIGKALSAIGLKAKHPLTAPREEDTNSGSTKDEDEGDEDEDESEEEEDEEEDEDEESAQESYDEDQGMEETAVERARRLQALGQVGVPRDEDDEEEMPVSVPYKSGVVSSIGRNLRKKADTHSPVLPTNTEHSEYE